MSLDVFAMDQGDDSRENNPKIYYPNGNQPGIMINQIQ